MQLFAVIRFYISYNILLCACFVLYIYIYMCVCVCVCVCAMLQAVFSGIIIRQRLKSEENLYKGLRNTCQNMADLEPLFTWQTQSSMVHKTKISIQLKSPSNFLLCELNKYSMSLAVLVHIKFTFVLSFI